ncbi:MAG: HD domain-containing phosphohydrolase [Pseudomonadota bacterium]
MLLTKPEHLLFLCKTPLYQVAEGGRHVIFKPPGKFLHDVDLHGRGTPPTLYLDPKDRPKAQLEVQEALNRQVLSRLEAGDLLGTRDALQEVLEVSLAEPNPASLREVGRTAEQVTVALQEEAGTAQAMARLSFTNYGTALHSVNVMLLALAFSMAAKLSLPQRQSLASAALLHDVGKVDVDQDILDAPRRLTDDEFKEIRRHATLGYRILLKAEFRDKAIPLAAYHHHERLDGSGYPQGLSDISPAGRVVAIIDCYEALTNDNRPYRQAMDPFAALKIVRADTDAGKFDRRVFDRFISGLL